MEVLTEEQKKEITKISKEFVSGFESTIPSINGSGYLIADPLSAYLNACGFKNKLTQLPQEGERPQILILNFEDGSQFIPAGEDLKFKFPEAYNYIWI